MSKKCPNCGKDIDYVNVSKQLEGTQRIEDSHGQHPIEYRPLNEQHEPEIRTCPKCHTEIDDKTVLEWGLE